MFNRNGFQQMMQSMMQQGGQNPSAFVNGFLQNNPQFAHRDLRLRYLGDG